MEEVNALIETLCIDWLFLIYFNKTVNFYVCKYFAIDK